MPSRAIAVPILMTMLTAVAAAQQPTADTLRFGALADSVAGRGSSVERPTRLVHWVNDGVWHTPLAQQPLGQLVPLQPVQAPLTHCCGAGQLWQANPELPQAEMVFPAMQAPLWQQPEGQLWASQTHWPARHRRPAPQEAPPPHWQTPLAQVSATAGSVTSWTEPDATLRHGDVTGSRRGAPSYLATSLPAASFTYT